MASFLSEEDTDTSAYYAILNVPRTASQEEIVKSYRKLAQVFHPDKHTDQTKQAHAQESFAKVQEAYEVLSDVHKRQIYDVYGKQGLSAGLEVGDHLRSKEEIRREWEEFKAKQARAAQDQAVVQKGSYICRIDARPLLEGRGMGQGSLFKYVSAQSALEAVVADKNVLSMSGLAVVKTVERQTPRGPMEFQGGGGNVMFGFKRIISDDDSLDLLGQVGLQGLVSVTSTRRLCRVSNRHGWVNSAWSPQTGVSLQVGCSQNLFSDKMDGSVNVVLGPAGATGVVTQITKRGAKYNVSLKLEIGTVHTISVRSSLTLTNSLYLRCIGRLGTTGIDLELGLAKKWSPKIIGYVGTCVGYPTGVVVKVRATRAGQSLECPICLSAPWADWRVAAAAYIVPPLLCYASLKLVVQPLVSWTRAHAEKAKSLRMAESTYAALEQAASEQLVIEAVAKRKVASELAAGSGKGLVIVSAVYGVLSEYKQHQQQQPSTSGGGSDAAASAQPAASTAAEAPSTSQPQQQQQDDQAGAPSSGRDKTHSSGRGSKRRPPVPWLEVTSALQYLVADSKLVLHGGVSKSGLMGFADPAPHTEDKHLSIIYWHQGSMHEVVVADKDGVVLPAAPGTAAVITDNVHLGQLQTKLQQLRASVSA